MLIQEDNNSAIELINSNFDSIKAAYPEDIPLIEAYDEQSFTLSDGMYHIEDF
jgi:hypothetical protein